MRQPAFFLLFAFAMVMSCSKPDEGEVAMQVAKTYYEHLYAGRYDDYLAGVYRPDSIPEGYRSQLIDNAKMFVAQQQKRRKGVKTVQTGRAVYNAAAHTADVFLILLYGDGTTEQVLVPMVEKDAVWYMR